MPGLQIGTVRTLQGVTLRPPADWELLPPGDAMLTRRVKQAGPTWVVQEKRGRKVFSRGLWAPAERIARLRAAVEAERADPAYARADMTTARLLACGELGLSAAEAQALIQPLRPLFGDAGFPIDAPVPQRWYLRCPPGAQLPAFSAPAEVLGDDLGRHLPTAAQGRRWRSLFNEAQILLHQHPLNAERVRRGQLPVNALWFWGGGTLPEWVRGAVTVVLGEDVPLRALAARAGVRAHAAEPAALAGLAADAAALLDLAVERDGGVLRTWIEAVAAALRDGRLSALDVRFESGERLHVTARQRWRFWRRLRPLPA